MRQTIIGIVGEKGSGKETFASILKECNSDRSFARVRSSDILAETLKMWNLPTTRHNLQHLAIIMDEQFGVGTLTEAVHSRILSLKEEIVVFDAVRWQSDADMIRSFPKNILIYIHADIRTRYDRTKARKQYMGEDFATYEKFLEEEQVATELEIGRIGKKADLKIENNGSYEDFKKQVEILNINSY